MAEPVNPFPRGSDRWERWNKRQERIKAKQARIDEAARKEAEKAEAVARCKEAMRRLPPEYQSWGAVRTAAYLKALRLCAGIARSTRPRRGSAMKAASFLQSAMTDPVESLNH